MTEKKKEELLIRLDENVKNQGRQLDEIWRKLNVQGDVRKDFDAHIGNHWKWVGFVISMTTVLAAIVGVVVKLAF